MLEEVSLLRPGFEHEKLINVFLNIYGKIQVFWPLWNFETFLHFHYENEILFSKYSSKFAKTQLFPAIGAFFNILAT